MSIKDTKNYTKEGSIRKWKNKKESTQLYKTKVYKNVAIVLTFIDNTWPTKESSKFSKTNNRNFK